MENNIKRWVDASKEQPVDGWRGMIRRNGEYASAHYDGWGNFLIGDEAFGIHGIEWALVFDEDNLEGEITTLLSENIALRKALEDLADVADEARRIYDKDGTLKPGMWAELKEFIINARSLIQPKTDQQ